MNNAQRAALVAFACLFTLALLLAAAIALTGGTALQVGSIVISMRSPANAVAAAALIAFVAAAVRFLPLIGVRVDSSAVRLVVRRLWPAAVVAGVIVAPLAVAAVHLWQHGDYSSQPYLWRSAPAGIDVGTFVLGNPRSFLWAGGPLHAFARFGIDSIEQVAWVGPGVMLLCLAALLTETPSIEARRWCAVGIVFLVWALGPYLVAFGWRLPVPLPATLIRYAPIAANARIPGRAMVVVYLALAMLSAEGVAALTARGRRTVALAFAALAIADLIPAAPPVYQVDHPAIYDVLRVRPEPGAVCELPLGLRDGFGEIGRFDTRVLWYQTIHERGLVGGFVARLPKRMIPAYQAAPVLGTFLRLSSGQAMDHEVQPAPDEATEALLSQGVRFVVLDRQSSPPDLVTYVNRLSLKHVAQDGYRELLMVERRGH